MISNKRPQLNRDYDALNFEASVLYIKNGLSAEAIYKRLNVSTVTIAKWVKAGRWKDLRPDMDALKEYKAADLYINGGLSTGEIAMKLSISEVSVKIWIRVNGWDVAKELSKAKGDYSEIINRFCSHYSKMFPLHATEIQAAYSDYISKL